MTLQDDESVMFISQLQMHTHRPVCSTGYRSKLGGIGLYSGAQMLNNAAEYRAMKILETVKGFWTCNDQKLNKDQTYNESLLTELYHVTSLKSRS